ncbi:MULTISPECIES: class I SAM-dependent methyltransferase [Oceanobacillus]|jgi:16S rRNA (guanine1207-N2)-methyltransferase|uniref:class I SAM-dependent methyltransferase n=1 Tax=Oceanobacillus TaxID=182709 RepID=UPI00204174A0|nr:class I SAM-dependent methyltransferase [Oceanobacillus profundus]MCM3399678.1 class I SAM-dependent methyltransferase [Oceanobacillus profundus]
MSEHYFSNKPQSKTLPKTWTYQLRGKKYTFTSDVGVFSKNEVDFGSRLLIEQFQEPSVPGDLLDLGCGYGPIGIALANDFVNRQVVMVDVNERALALAEKNATINNQINTEVIQSDRLSGLPGRKFAAILTNPPIRAGKQVVHQMFEDSKKALLPDGQLWVVIQKKQGAPSAMDKIEDLFGNVDVVIKSKGYYILRALNV